jgi:DNA-directed RNA polymerase subunit H (RpoH/RPB5)
MMLDRYCKDPILSDESHYKEWMNGILDETKKGDSSQGFFHTQFQNYQNTGKEVHVMVCTIKKTKLHQLRQEMKLVKSPLLIVISLFPFSSNNEKYMSSSVHSNMRIQLFYCSNL